MGQNRRYGSDVTWAAIAETVLRPQPISLREPQIGANPTAIPDAPRPILVQAWVQFPQGIVLVEGKAVAWHNRAVCVEFSLMNDAPQRAWVWASAVDRR